MKAILVTLILSVAITVAVGEQKHMAAMNLTSPFAFPMFKQCDSRWGNDELGTCSQTVCVAGCAMSCVAMMLASKGWSGDPGTLNAWLKDHGGYADGCEIDWATVDSLGHSSCLGHVTDSYHTLCDMVGQGYGITINVRGGSHWVLITGCTKGNNIFDVNDPYFAVDTYTMSDVVGQVAYKLKMGEGEGEEGEVKDEAAKTIVNLRCPATYKDQTNLRAR